MKEFVAIFVSSCILLLFGAIAGMNYILDSEIGYQQREKIALEWMAKHQDKWRYTLCNTPMDGK